MCVQVREKEKKRETKRQRKKTERNRDIERKRQTEKETETRRHSILTFFQRVKIAKILFQKLPKSVQAMAEPIPMIATSSKFRLG